MADFKESVRKAARAALADFVGFAGRERFEGMDAVKNPFNLFPEAKTVVVIGRRITRGTLRGIEEGVNFGDYGSFGQGWLANEFVAETLYETATAIERMGWEAMPLTPGLHTGVAGVSGPCDPDFNYCAVAAGLGEIGMSGEVLTPRFGPRQRFAIIVTDAECESDPLLEKPVCTKCGRCAAICPLNALGPEITDINVAGKHMPVYTCNIRACAKCQNGAAKAGYMETVMYGAVRETVEGIDRKAAVCTRTCVAALEDVVENKLDLKFRQREVWRKNEFGEILPPVPADEA
ncbi:MAG: hypothetical protein ACOXZM_05690 [Eubacteriales bacterium]|jgi:epoxyqueuosine reductase